MKEKIDELEKIKKEISEILTNINENYIERKNDIQSSNEENGNYLQLSSVSNFMMFLSSVEKDRNKTINSKSGMAHIAMDNILKNINQLMKSDYQELRRSGKIHQINTNTGGFVIPKYNCAYERYGNGTTKLAYIRIPILEENKKILCQYYKNNNLKYLILVVRFGDFKNLGVSESDLYDAFREEPTKKSEEIGKIIEIFKNPFTVETFELAKRLIEGGQDIITTLATEPQTPIFDNQNSKGVKK